MQQTRQKQPVRSVGALDILSLINIHGTNFVRIDFRFRANCPIDDDVMQSAMQEAARQVPAKLAQNGLRGAGEPSVQIDKVKNREVTFMVRVPTTPIILKRPGLLN